MRTPLVILASGCLLAFTGCGSSTAAPQPANRSSSASAVPQLNTVKPVRTKLARVTEQPGQVEAFEQAPLFARVSGYVEQLHVDLGDRVKKGQALAQLAAPELEDDVKQKDALVAQCKAEHAQAKAAQIAAEARIETAAAGIREAQAGHERAEANLLRAQDELKRVDELVRSSSVAAQLGDEARYAARAADAGRQESTAKIASAKALLSESRAIADKAKADVTAAEARVNVASAELDHARTMFSYTTIAAPFDGVISVRNVDVGHYIPIGAENNRKPLFTVVHADTVRVFLEVPEAEAVYTQPGDAAVVRVPAMGNSRFIGKVTRISSELSPSNRTLRTEIDLPNAEGKLIPGMYVLAAVTVEERPEVLTLPLTAIATDTAGESSCFVVEDKKLSRKSIKVGLQAGLLIEIVSGLSSDEDVVKVQNAALADGQVAESVPGT